MKTVLENSTFFLICQTGQKWTFWDRYDMFCVIKKHIHQKVPALNPDPLPS